MKITFEQINTCVNTCVNTIVSNKFSEILTHIIELEDPSYPCYIQVEYDNGWELSIVRNFMSYGGNRGLWEVAVIKDGKIDYTNPLTNGDVLGYIPIEELEAIIETVDKWDPQ